MLDQFKLLVRAGYPLVSIQTQDELGAVALLRRAAADLGKSLLEWSITRGLIRVLPPTNEPVVAGGKVAPALDYVRDQPLENAIYVFKDVGPHARDAGVVRQFRELHLAQSVTAVLVDADPLPDALRRLTVSLDLPLPDAADLERLIRDTFRQIKSQSLYEIIHSLTARDLECIVQILRGLPLATAGRVIAAAIHDDQALTAEDIPRIVEAKRNLLSSTGCLESIGVNVSVDQIGGLANLKRWLAKRRRGNSAKAREFGLEPPRGILLLGVQGCGKSLCAKMVAADWQWPLLRLDPGVLYQRFVGESENRLRQALDQAEAMSPVILWIDEIEKAFASASAESADGGLSQRMFGTLLSWMQDHRSPIFLVATANNISALPPELMRKGRFDEVFFVDLPDAAARQGILAIHLARRKRDPAKFALVELAAASEGFSGAELEQVVISGLYQALADDTELTDAHLRQELAATQPLSVLMAERVASLRAWAKDRCVPAD